MDEADARQEGEAAAGAPSVAPVDFTNVRGFQVLTGASAAPSDAAAPDEETWRRELAKEFAARAARFAEAVDDAIVLAHDGAIRWLGDPVAKLVAGEEMLKPRAVILADDALPAEGREAAQQRVALWLAAHIRKTLGPLLALVDVEAVPEAVRDLAVKLSQSLGILERERVKSQVKALDQNARGALRKLGVRFGAHYLYVPALLKPGARALCAQLWALSRGEADKEAVADKLLHFASSGRTSFAVEPPASGEVYRVAGFRLCGDRAVRVDIVERLTDLIRAALPRHAPIDAGASGEASLVGFVVTNQMTSLTGCSGEHFASILRSLGFANHHVKKAAYLAALKAAEPSPPAAPSPPEADAAPPAAQDEHGALPEISEAAVDVAAVDEASSVSAVARPEPTTHEDAPAAADSVHAGDDNIAVAALDAASESPALETPAPAVAVDEAPSEPVVAEMELTTDQDESAAHEEATAAAESAHIGDDDIVDSAPENPAPDAPDAVAELTAPPAPPPAEASGVGADELIEIWRPAPRRPRHSGRDHGRPQRHAQPAAPTEARPAHDNPPRKPWRDRPRPAAPHAAQPEAPRAPESTGPAGGQRPTGEPGREGRRPPWRRDGAKGGRFEENRNAEAGADKPKGRPQPVEPRKPSVNLDSPFAKLLDLKPLLKSRDTAK